LAHCDTCKLYDCGATFSGHIFQYHTLSDTSDSSIFIVTNRAPEVACHQKYNLSADVYSFAMVAYEMCSLQKPFDGWTRDMHSNLVCERGMRPDTTLVATTLLPDAASSTTYHRIPLEMRVLLEHAWSEDPSKRPSVTQITSQVQLLREQQLLLLEELIIRQQVLQLQQQHEHEQHRSVLAAVAVAAVTPPAIFYMDMEQMDPHFVSYHSTHNQHPPMRAYPHLVDPQHQQFELLSQQQLFPQQHHQQQQQLDEGHFPFVFDTTDHPHLSRPTLCYNLPLQDDINSPRFHYKNNRRNSLDSIGTIETESLSAESQELFF
jgi:serine/threonine protein kinase